MSSYIKTIIIVFLLIIIIFPYTHDIDSDIFNKVHDNLSSEINDFEKKTAISHIAYTLDYTIKCENIEKRSIREHSMGKTTGTLNLDVLPVYINNTCDEILTFSPNYVSIVYDDGTSYKITKEHYISYDKSLFFYSMWGNIYAIPPNGYTFFQFPFDRIDLDKNPTFVLGITRYDRQGNYIDDDTIEIKLSGLEYIIV